MHQLTLLLSTRRREAETQASASTADGEPEEPAVAVIENEEPPRRCLNESAHKLYR